MASNKMRCNSKGGRTGKFADKTIGIGKSCSRTPVSEVWERKAQNQEDMRTELFRNSERSYAEERKCHILKAKRRGI